MITLALALVAIGSSEAPHAPAVKVSEPPASEATDEGAAFVSQVYQAPGTDVPTLTRRALACIPQTVGTTLITEPQIVSSDVSGGLVVANAGFQFTHVPYKGRSTLTFEAKPERFRFTHTRVASFTDHWAAMVATNSKVSARLSELNDQIAACILKSGTSSAW